jgi:hypothetical protein
VSVTTSSSQAHSRAQTVPILDQSATATYHRRITITFPPQSRMALTIRGPVLPCPRTGASVMSVPRPRLPVEDGAVSFTKARACTSRQRPDGRYRTTSTMPRQSYWAATLARRAALGWGNLRATISAICTAFNAAPLRRLSFDTNSTKPLSTVGSRRIRPT